jgi:hypothetical protein
LHVQAEDVRLQVQCPTVNGDTADKTVSKQRYLRDYRRLWLASTGYIGSVVYRINVDSGGG